MSHINTSTRPPYADVLYSLDSKILLEIEKAIGEVDEKRLICRLLKRCIDGKNKLGDEGTKTFIIFDWDDTLFPTSYLQNEYGDAIRFYNMSEADRNQLRQVDDLIVRVFKIALEEANLSLITNANLVWLSHSAYEFLPRTYNFIFGKHSNISVLSARDKYGWRYRSRMILWKYLAFDNYINKHVRPKRRVEIISIGDAMFEHEAAFYAIRHRHGSTVKNVVLRRFPSIADITHEMMYLFHHLEDIIRVVSSMEFEFRGDGSVSPMEMSINALNNIVEDVSSIAGKRRRTSVGR